MIFGHSGSGKSTWLLNHIDEFKPFVLVDPLFDVKFKALNLHCLTSCDEALQIFKEKDPQRIYISPNLETFDFFCALVLARGNMTIVVDEVDNYCTSYFISPYFKKVIKVGRHRNVSLIAVCRRPKEMNPYLRSQANRFIVFPMGKEDLITLSSYMPRNILEICYRLKSYQDHSEFVDYNFNTKEYTMNRLDYYVDIR